MMLEFKIVGGEEFPLKLGQLYLIGRKTNGNDIKIGPNVICQGDDTSLELKHALVEICDDETALLVDLQSTVGTFLNGRRLESMLRTKITVADSLRFGLHLNAKLRINPSDAERSHNSSGFHDGHKNTSDIIESSPEVSKRSQSRRAAAAFKNDFLIPAAPLSRLSQTKANSSTFISPNTSGSTTAETSFPEIPETQYFQKPSSGNANVSVVDNDDTIDDFFIPETQEVAPNYFQANNAIVDANLSDSQCAADGSSQFHICTQLFNEDCMVNINSNSSDSFDFLMGAKRDNAAGFGEQVKTPVQPKGTAEVNADNTEMNSLNWSADNTSKNTTLNGTAADQRDGSCTPDLCDFPEEQQKIINEMYKISTKTTDSLRSSADVHRDDASTPDFCDFPEELQTKIKDIYKISTTMTETRVEATNALAELFAIEEEEDLPPTQVFIKKKPTPEKEEQQLEKSEPIYLTLSDKENSGPAATAADIVEMHEDVLSKTQVFITKEVSFTSAQIKAMKTIPAVVTNKPLVEDIYDGKNDLIAPTQLFTSSSSAAKTCFNSTLLVNDDKPYAKDAASFFEAFEKTPAKTQIRSRDDAFKKPEPVVTIKKTATLFDLDIPTESESDMLMCTPQFLKEKFVKCSASDINKCHIAAKQRSLFGEDSDVEEEADVLKLINASKKMTSKDFDMLQPKDKISLNSHKKASTNTTTQQVNNEEMKAQKMHSLFGSSKSSSSKRGGEKKVENRSRDERRAARDKERESKSAAEKTLPVLATISKHGSKRKSPSKTETVSEAKMKKRDSTKSKEVEKLAKTTSKMLELSVEKKKKEKSSKDKSEKQSHSKFTKPHSKKMTEMDKPTRRVTRLQSRTELSQDEEEKVKKAKQSTTAQTERSTRTRLTSHSEESGNSFGAAASADKCNDRKRKVQVDERSTSSQDDSNASGSSSTCSKKLKITMTMVDPKLFNQLTSNSSGIWSIAENPIDSDVLIMDKGNRTYKFLLAMAKGIPIVTSKWLEFINSTHKISHMAEHFFTDAAFEKRHKFTLIKSLERARKQRIFGGYHFLMTPGIMPQPKEMKSIVKCAGGIVHTEPPSASASQKIYLISSSNEKQLWHKYRRVNNNIRIISCEGVMSAVMRQQVEPLDKFFLS